MNSAVLYIDGIKLVTIRKKEGAIRKQGKN